jgi:alpha-galactosidase
MRNRSDKLAFRCNQPAMAVIWRLGLVAGLAMLDTLVSADAFAMTAARRGEGDHAPVARTVSEAVDPESAVVAGHPTSYFRTGSLPVNPAPPPGFAFSLGGATSGAITSAWPAAEVVTLLDSNRTQRLRTYTRPADGFRVQVESVDFADYPAREWKLWFEQPPGVEAFSQNPAGLSNPAATDLLSNVWAGEITLSRDPGGEFALHYADGSTAVVNDFQPRTSTLLPNSALNFAPVGGRSSDGVLPFFNIAKPGGGGLIVAVGWTGQWRAAFARDGGTNLTVRVGMEDFNLRLYPGERIRTPGVLTLSYEGDWLEGQRQLRRLLLDHFSPRPNGRPIDRPIAASGATIGFNNVTAANQIQAISNIVQKRLSVNTYWIDAGWEIGGFATGQGNNIPDPVRFPNGIAPVSQYAHAHGLRFLLWFEPERVMPNTWLRNNHPDWLLVPSGMPPEYAYQQNDGWRMLNLGHPAALAWAKTNFSAIVGNWGIDIYRHDFNMHPLWYWRTGEASDRKGMNEIRHVMGLYDYFDTLQRDHPGLLLDNSASGGRRLDYEMYRRLVPLLRSDYLWEVVGAQAMTYALSLWLPMIGQGGVSTANIDFRSGMGSWATYAFDYYSPNAAFWPTLESQLTNLVTLAPLFSGDFYPLTPYSTNNTDWIAWQCDRPDLGEGLVQAFRRAGNGTPVLGLRLLGLQPAANYRLTHFEMGTTLTASGRTLMTDGLTVRVPTPPEAATLRYQRVFP